MNKSLIASKLPFGKSGDICMFGFTLGALFYKKTFTCFLDLASDIIKTLDLNIENV